jgi:superfamily II DNA/RNA helicase
MNHFTIFSSQANSPLNPEFVVIDEADLLLELDKNVSKNTDKLIQHIRKHSPASAATKYFLTASSFPKKYKAEEALSKLQEHFKTLRCISGINTHKLP